MTVESYIRKSGQTMPSGLRLETKRRSSDWPTEYFTSHLLSVHWAARMLSFDNSLSTGLQKIDCNRYSIPIFFLFWSSNTPKGHHDSGFEPSFPHQRTKTAITQPSGRSDRINNGVYSQIISALSTCVGNLFRNNRNHRGVCCGGPAFGVSMLQEKTFFS